MSHAWMPLYIADYLADTGHLSTLEHGAYMLLIMNYWKDGGLPSDEAMIRRLCRMSPEQWAESRDVLASMFGDGWSHKRIDEELTKATEIVEKRRSAADARHSKRKSNASAEQVHSTCSDTGVPPSPTPNISDASASGAVAPQSPRDILWREGVSTLIAISGLTDTKARQMIGRWCRDAGDDCALVLAKIQRAQADKIGEPVSWITAALKPPDKPPKPQNLGEFFRQDARDMGILDDKPPLENARRVDTGNGSGQGGSPGIARRFTVPADVLGDIGQSRVLRRP